MSRLTTPDKKIKSLVYIKECTRSERVAGHVRFLNPPQLLHVDLLKHDTVALIVGMHSIQEGALRPAPAPIVRASEEVDERELRESSAIPLN
jgi:hypothetical protein